MAMKKSLILSLTSLLFSFLIPTVKALSTDKTYFVHRPQGENIPLEHMLQRKLLPENLNKKQIILQATPFFEMSQNRSKFVQYLMFDDKSSLNIGRNTDIDNRHLKFDETSTSNLTGNITLRPKTETYGILFSYFQPLKKISKNLFFKANIPLVHFRFDPELRVKRRTISSEGNKTIEDYFAGQVMVQGMRPSEEFPRILQDPLEFGKISNYTRLKTSVADINLMFSYKKEIIENKFLINWNGFLTIPTNSSPRSEWLLEPIIGTAGHWALGAGLDGYFELTNSLEFIFDIRYKYLLEGNEKRILGLKNSAGQKLKWGQYSLFGLIASPKVLPAANALAQEVDVRPRARLECLLMFAYNAKHLSFQVGYDFWLKQRDIISRVRAWENNRYGLVGSNYLTDLVKILNFDTDLHPQSTFKLQHSNLNNTIGVMQQAGANSNLQGTILDTQLDHATAETPHLISHKFFVAVERLWKNNPISYFLGCGLSFEFPNDNARLQQLGLWLKGGFLF